MRLKLEGLSNDCGRLSEEGSDNQGRWLMIAGGVLVVLKATKAPKNAISRLLVINEKRDVVFKAQVLTV